MGFGDWLSAIFGRVKGDKSSFKLTDCVGSLAVEAFYRDLALESCISLIANIITLCEFQTFHKGKKEKGSNYYLLNVRPNKNQSAGNFIHRLVSKLIRENECIVVMHGDMLFLADSFDVKEYALYENVYSNIQIGDFTFTSKTFAENEVLHFELHDKNIAGILRRLHNCYGKLLASAQDVYKRKNGTRVVLELDTLRPQDVESQDVLQDLFDNQFAAWFDSENPASVLPLGKGMSLKDWSDKDRGGKGGDTRDIRALIDDIFDFTATGFHMPKGLVRGDTVNTDDQINSLVMFCVNPIVHLLQTETNAKMYTKQDFLDKSYVRIDTSKIKLQDVNKLATAADKLFAAGVNTINDNLEMLGRETIDADWADARFITKNYETVEIRIKGDGNSGNAKD